MVDALQEVVITENQVEQLVRFSHLENEVRYYNYIRDFLHKLSEFQNMCGLSLRKMNK